jgi:hypothetical protein
MLCGATQRVPRGGTGGGLVDCALLVDTLLPLSIVATASFALHSLHRVSPLPQQLFFQVYARLGVDSRLTLQGESFYNDRIPGVLEELACKGLLEESEGAMVLKVPGFEVRAGGGARRPSREADAVSLGVSGCCALWSSSFARYLRHPASHRPAPQLPPLYLSLPLRSSCPSPVRPTTTNSLRLRRSR